MSKPTDEWGTPQWLYDLLDEEFDFGLDVCASKKNHKHENYYTIKENALDQEWEHSNFCNPPYSNILPWYEFGIGSRSLRGQQTVFVAKYDPSTKHGCLAKEEMDEIRIIQHRIKYQGAPTGANFPSAIMVCRPRLYTRKSGAREVYCDFRRHPDYE